MPVIHPQTAYLALLIPGLFLTGVARAQMAMTTAVDLALRNSPRVQIAAADVTRARAALAETRDVYIPSLSGGSGLGYSYGFPLGQPTLFNFQAQSLAFSYSQRDYIRAAKAALAAATLTLMDVRQAVAEDTVNTCVALAHDGGREAALAEQRRAAEKLVGIVQARLDAGQDTAMGLTSAQLTAAQIRLNLLHAEDDSAVDRLHLAHLVGLPASDVAFEPKSIPAIPQASAPDSPPAATASPGVAAAYANARAKQEQAFGDARYLWRPQMAFAAEYSRFSTFNNYQEYYERLNPVTHQIIPFQYNAIGIGVQITLPILDYAHRAKARESLADAHHAEREADQERDQFLEGRLRTERTMLELAARAEVAALDQQLAQQQLDVLDVQLQAAAAGAAPMTPKDEQNARISERDKFLALLDAQFQMRQAQVNLLRQSGELEPWLQSVAAKASSSIETPQASALHP